MARTTTVDEEAAILAAKIKADPDSWDLEQCRALCELAGLLPEWDEADGETFESVIYKAAQLLDVEIL